MIKTKYVCTKCGGDNILYDAWARWNPDTQEMELERNFDNTFCEDCESECSTKKVEEEEQV